MYQANISAKENNNIDKAYIGMTSLKWKFRFYNHLQSYRNSTLGNQTALSLKSKRTRTNTCYKLKDNKKIHLDK